MFSNYNINIIKQQSGGDKITRTLSNDYSPRSTNSWMGATKRVACQYHAVHYAMKKKSLSFHCTAVYIGVDIGVLLSEIFYIPYYHVFAIHIIIMYNDQHQFAALLPTFFLNDRGTC